MNLLKHLLFFILLFNNLLILGQTLIINEVSNGPSGNKEYVEFIVVDTSVTYNCFATTPPCIDIRGWIFDDNSGYHGGAGIATGAIRFSFDPLWQCVPLGTIIVVNNDADPNPLMPATDISLVDGNCQIVAPISDPNLFDTNPTTPGAIACSYPATGWVPGGNWSSTLLANGGDCARIVDLSGCEVFSVCWGSNNQNTLIYFPDGATTPGSASNTVYYFNGGDPTNQADWTVGCADVPACGIEEQTPGAPNNAANSAYIAQFNNNCTPITPIVASAVVDNDAVCECNGQATASGSGSIPGYTYEWQDAGGTPIGQTAATATGLCAGTYQVVVTSSIGCTDVASVVIGSSGTVQVDVNSETVCEGEEVILSATPSAPGGTYVWSPGGATTDQITITAGVSVNYDVTYTLGSCVDNATATITVVPTPVASFATNPSSGSEPLDVTFTNTSSNASDYYWNFGDGTDLSTTSGSPILNTYNLGGYNVMLIASNGNCADTAYAFITVIESDPPLIRVPNVFTPNGDDLNDVYFIYSENIAQLEGLIINRWGNLMLEFNSVNFEWDGKVDGEDASEGTYFIKYKATGFNQEELSGHTFFQLIRK